MGIQLQDNYSKANHTDIKFAVATLFETLIFIAYLIAYKRVQRCFYNAE